MKLCQILVARDTHPFVTLPPVTQIVTAFLLLPPHPLLLPLEELVVVITALRQENACRVHPLATLGTLLRHVITVLAVVLVTASRPQDIVAIEIAIVAGARFA